MYLVRMYKGMYLQCLMGHSRETSTNEYRTL